MTYFYWLWQGFRSDQERWVVWTVGKASEGAKALAEDDLVVLFAGEFGPSRPPTRLYGAAWTACANATSCAAGTLPRML